MHILLVSDYILSVRRTQAKTRLIIQVESNARDCDCSESYSDVVEGSLGWRSRPHLSTMNEQYLLKKPLKSLRLGFPTENVKELYCTIAKINLIYL